MGCLFCVGAFYPDFTVIYNLLTSSDVIVNSGFFCYGDD